MGTGIRQSAFDPLIAQIERNLAIAIENDYPGREQLLYAIAGQLQEITKRSSKFPKIIKNI